MFTFLHNALRKMYDTVTNHFTALFSRGVVDDSMLQELENLLIGADTGVDTAQEIVKAVRQSIKAGAIVTSADVKRCVQQELMARLIPASIVSDTKTIYLMVGVNGGGKTTFSGRFAHSQSLLGKKVLVAAADTFRAAATQQLASWAERYALDLVTASNNQDTGVVVFNACQQYMRDDYDLLIIDTAGRLQTKAPLMAELAKIKRIIERQAPGVCVVTLLVIDAMLGQNSLEQAKIFNDSTALTGIVLTKMDGTGKGGIVFAISKELRLPIMYISCGQEVDSLLPFDPAWYVQNLLGQ